MKTHLLLAAIAIAIAVSGCGGDDAQASSGDSPPDSSWAARDSSAADTSATPGPAGPAEKGFFDRVVAFLTSDPRRKAEKQAGNSTECSTEKDYSGRSLPHHSLPIDNGNDFNTTYEAFLTSSPEAQTPYVAYATWDPCALYLGLTGSAVGAGDCDGGDCATVDRGESPYRYWLVYIDTDPQGTAGSAQPRELGPTPARLPMRADYLLEIRLDGATIQAGDGYNYQGNAQLYQRTSDWRVGLEEAWQPSGRQALEIGDNSSSNFLEVSVSRSALGDPCAVGVLGWVVDTDADEAFAYWPPPRRGPQAIADSFTVEGVLARAKARRDSAKTENARAGNGQAGNAQTENDRRKARRDSLRRRNARAASRASGDTSRGRAARVAGGRATRDTASSGPTRRTSAANDSLVLDTYGFLLMDGQRPNSSGNLNRTDYSLVTDGCAKPTRPRE